MRDIALLADDLTGAMDSGLTFGRRGLVTLVPLAPGAWPGAQVLSVDTDSREAPAAEAMRRVTRAAEAVRGRLLFKKVDSTMRGNVGYELRALQATLRTRGIVVAPAFPRSGRTTLGGVQRVDGRPLELTPFRHDPRWPMAQSHLPTLLMQQSGREVGWLGIEIVERGPQALTAALSACPEPIVVVDALTEAHLQTIAAAVVALGDRWLPCGSAGLAEAWADALGLGGEAGWPWPEPEPRPVLLAAGSRNEVTVAQLRAAIDERGLAAVEPDPGQWWDAQREVARLAEECLRELARGRDVVLTSSFIGLVAGRGESVADLIAQTVARVRVDVQLGGLFLTGGDIAVAACRTLGAQALSIRHQVQPGVPGGELVGGGAAGLRVVTKAGGLGDGRAALDALDYLHGRPLA